jgi:hypothetical protein
LWHEYYLKKRTKIDLIELSTKEFKVSIKKVKVIDCKQDPKTLLFFLNYRLKNVMGEAGFSEIRRTVNISISSIKRKSTISICTLDIKLTLLRWKKVYF